jgi:hypothetical protein
MIVIGSFFIQLRPEGPTENPGAIREELNADPCSVDGVCGGVKTRWILSPSQRFRNSFRLILRPLQL